MRLQITCIALKVFTVRLRSETRAVSGARTQKKQALRAMRRSDLFHMAFGMPNAVLRRRTPSACCEKPRAGKVRHRQSCEKFPMDRLWQMRIRLRKRSLPLYGQAARRPLCNPSQAGFDLVRIYGCRPFFPQQIREPVELGLRDVSGAAECDRSDLGFGQPANLDMSVD